MERRRSSRLVIGVLLGFVLAQAAPVQSGSGDLAFSRLKKKVNQLQSIVLIHGRKLDLTTSEGVYQGPVASVQVKADFCANEIAKFDKSGNLFC